MVFPAEILDRPRPIQVCHQSIVAEAKVFDRARRGDVEDLPQRRFASDRIHLAQGHGAEHQTRGKKGAGENGDFSSVIHLKLRCSKTSTAALRQTSTYSAA